MKEKVNFAPKSPPQKGRKEGEKADRADAARRRGEKEKKGGG